MGSLISDLTRFLLCAHTRHVIVMRARPAIFLTRPSPRRRRRVGMPRSWEVLVTGRCLPD